MSFDSMKTFWVDDLEFFPSNFLGMKKPDIGFFLAVEGQSTDDGKIFINSLNDQEVFQYVTAVLPAADADRVVSQAKISLKSRAFKEWAADDETEHGLAMWNTPSGDVMLLGFGTQGSTEFTEKVFNWLGEGDLTYDQIKTGIGSLDLSDVDKSLLPSQSSSKMKV